ncbi:glycosyltransferase family 2 protein [Muriicola soli]|uniref:Glycosyltransferase n=1 Tax=Muriicola soli TaxID=2507538 RepID=A0A411E957_9FLAO|nr:glycosyltransferase family 2 protein [Muriicola soli]QBA64265.1 glycosyltransferase [Muriicola soli]
MNIEIISILMPFRNTEKYLKECLDSVLSQTYPHWELIAVDDHSRDSSYALVSKYSHADSRIKLIKNKGEGIIMALRTALQVASGGMVSRMDSDDVMVPDKLEIMQQQLHTAGKGHIALGLVNYFSAKGIGNGYLRYQNWLNGLTMKGRNFEERYKECVIPSPCWMVFKEDLYKCSAFDENRYPEDYDLAFRMYEAGLKCLPSQKVLHLWRDYASRTSRTSPDYANNSFLKIKSHYFLKHDRIENRPLLLWGAGTKGKTTARLLLENDCEFHWVCDNPKKTGKKIYGQKLRPYEAPANWSESPQSIITVANSKAQLQIRNYLNGKSHVEMTDYFFFC